MADPNPAAHPARLCRLEPIAIDAPASLSDFAMSVPDAGAIMSFTGQVRPFREGVAVSHLHLQAHDTLTKALMTERLDWACGHWSLDGGSMIHRIGDVARGDTIVLVATASAHRRGGGKAPGEKMGLIKKEGPGLERGKKGPRRAWVGAPAP
ncbi:MAG: molybdenum cofactor biosynthesis protein MoaE, partial [Pseudomonadota bacterium]